MRAAPPPPDPLPQGEGEVLGNDRAARHQIRFCRGLPACLAFRYDDRRDIAAVSAFAWTDHRPGTGPDRHRRSVEIGADLVGTCLRRVRARWPRRRASWRGDGGLVARESHRRSVHLAAAAIAVDHLDPADHPLARHRRAAEGRDRLPRFLDLHPVLYARRRAARRSDAGSRRAQPGRRATAQSCGRSSCPPHFPASSRV